MNLIFNYDCFLIDFGVLRWVLDLVLGVLSSSATILQRERERESLLLYFNCVVLWMPMFFVFSTRCHGLVCRL